MSQAHPEEPAVSDTSIPRKTWAIDAYLRETSGYEGKKLMLRDPLWFWGFITQRSGGVGGKRTFESNEAKYRAIWPAPKGAPVISEIRAAAEKFLAMLWTRAQEARLHDPRA